MRDPERQVDHLIAPTFHAEFFLTQVVSHFELDPVARFIQAAERRGLALAGMFGVFFYRSANARTLGSLKSFIPVPAQGLTREFGAGATAEEICARTIRALRDIGARHFYISNLPLGRAHFVLDEILQRAGAKAPAGPASDPV